MAEVRVRAINDAPVRADRGYVLYWMIAARRTRYNAALERAVEQARALNRPLVVFEPLRCDYPWASDRLHAFVLQGMQDNARALARRRVLYYPFVERARGEGKGLLARLASHACLVVTDDYPAFFLPRMVAAAGRALDVRLEAIDSNGLIPLATADRVFTTAASFRRFVHKTLPTHLGEGPAEDPFAGVRLPQPPQLSDLPDGIAPATELALLDDLPRNLSALPIDHGVSPVAMLGGQTAAARVLVRFMDDRLGRYLQDRNELERDAASGLSPYLHFGHISVHDIFAAIMTRERWTTRKIQAKAAGRREGWWGARAETESFLDELQEDPGVVRHAAVGARDDDPLEQQVRRGRPRSEFL